ncbi:MAG: sugar kinase [Planctomycetota bacterium]|nr:MAG: sugar kinase [Planctomycetota bacterium]
MSLVAVGSVGLDTVETPFGKVEEVIGGSAVYFSLAASLFTRIQIAANVGNDFPDRIWQLLAERGADLSGIKVIEDMPTFRWSGRYQGDMNEAETLRTELNVLALPPETPESYGGSPFVFLANMGADVQLATLQRLQGRYVFADTMNLWIETQRDLLLELMAKLHGLILNETEARMLTGETNLIKAGGALLDLGPRVVVIKKGEHGAFLFERSFHFALPAYPTAQVVDPTGAGDSFAGGFLGALADMGSLEPTALRRAMALGTVTASLTVEHFSTGGLEAADRKEVDRRFRELHEFVRL